MSTIDVHQAIIDAANKYGINPDLLLAQATAESGLDQSKINPKSGAIGIMQLLPGTAADMGVDPHDELQNIDGGAKYLAQQLSTYNGDEALALAAYNAGPGNVNKYGGVPPFAETQNYVAKILGSLGIQWSPGSTPDNTPVVDENGNPIDTGTTSDAGMISAGFSPIAVAVALGLGLLALLLSRD